MILVAWTEGLDHPCVVKLIEVFNSEEHVFIAMEAVDGVDLHEELRRRGRMDEARARGLFQQVRLSGTVFCCCCSLSFPALTCS